MRFEIPAAPNSEEIAKNEGEGAPSDVKSVKGGAEVSTETEIHAPEGQEDKAEAEMSEAPHQQTRELGEHGIQAKGIGRNLVGKKIEQIKRAVKETLTPEKYITEAIPWIGELGLSKDKISWIAAVRRHSEKLEDEDPKSKTAFDLVKLHLMAQRELKLDQFSHRREYLQKETEVKADGIIGYILLRYNEGREEGGREEFYDDILGPSIRRMKTARTPDEKLVAVSRYINVVHHGGNPVGMNIFEGYPEYEWGGDEKYWRLRNVESFFSALNDL